MKHLGIRSQLRPLIRASLLLCAACEDAESATECPAEVDGLLAEAKLSVPDRKQCGAFNSGDTAAAAKALACLQARDESSSRELTVTKCEDCSILATYIITAEGDMLHVFREADHFGDDRREVAVERCSDIVAHPHEAITCVDPRQLFSCQDTLPGSSLSP